MLTKKKMATLAATGMVTVGLLVGGASYALFTDTATSSENDFTSGTLELSTHRHDVPISGPMFYFANNDNGRMGTGYWAPLDSHTRAMFIENTGSLDGKITNIKAESSSADAAAFAKQALVTVAVFESGGVAVNEDLAREINEAADRLFDDTIDHWFSLVREGARTLQGLEAVLRQAALDFEFAIDNKGNSIRITDVYVDTLDKMMTTNGFDIPEEKQIQLQSDETMHLGFTVTLLDDQMDGVTFENNDIKGVEPEFKFTTQFTQVRNNN